MGRFYRLVSQRDLLLRDLLSLAELGHPPYDDPELQLRAEDVSVWDSLAAALDLAKRKKWRGFVAVLEVPAGVELRRGRRGHWGIPKGTGAEAIKKWVVEVLDIP